MLHNMGHTMARGNSGRIVLEIDPSLKRRVYSALSAEGMTLKDWFVSNVTTYLEEREQMPLWPIRQMSPPDGFAGTEASPAHSNRSTPQ